MIDAQPKRQRVLPLDPTITALGLLEEAREVLAQLEPTMARPRRHAQPLRGALELPVQRQQRADDQQRQPSGRRSIEQQLPREHDGALAPAADPVPAIVHQLGGDEAITSLRAGADQQALAQRAAEAKAGPQPAGALGHTE